MEKISFFTPLEFSPHDASSKKTKVLEAVDRFFYFGGKKALVIELDKKKGLDVVLATGRSPNCLEVALKVIICFTVVIPLLLLIVKAVLRCGKPIRVLQPKAKDGPECVSETMFNEKPTFEQRFQLGNKHITVGYKNADPKTPYSFYSVSSMGVQDLSQSSSSSMKDSSFPTRPNEPSGSQEEFKARDPKSIKERFKSLTLQTLGLNPNEKAYRFYWEKSSNQRVSAVAEPKEYASFQELAPDIFFAIEDLLSQGKALSKNNIEAHPSWKKHGETCDPYGEMCDAYGEPQDFVDRVLDALKTQGLI